MNQGDGGKKDFFISYTGADVRWAEWIAWQLEEAGYCVVLQAWDFGAGSNFVLEMQRASAGSKRTIAVLSPDYLKSVWAQPEWAAAFDPQGRERTLVPVMVRECTLEGLLARVVHIRLVGLDEAAARAALLKGLGRGRLKPDEPPPFPVGEGRGVPRRPHFPGALPPIWNVPHRRNPHFTGREGLLKDLQEALASGKPAALTQVIAGLGGVGKTQLAVEYAYRHASDYRLVWWVRAEEPATLASDYAALAGELGLPQKELGDQGLVVGAVRRWLEQDGEWLLVFDNAPDPRALGDYLPRGVTGHVLVTSRNPNWSAAACVLQVKVMSRPEAVEFLCRRTGQADEAAAGELAEELGGLPLALEQAAAYVEATGRRLKEYLGLFRTRHGELWARAGPPSGYPATVATTWTLSFQLAEAESPAGADLLRLCAFLGPDDIPRELLSQGAAGLPEPLSMALADPVGFDGAVAALRRYSLLETSGDALPVHRLVQVVTRDRLAEGARKAWAAAAVGLVDGAFPFDSDDVRTWPRSARLLPHALAAAGHAEALGVGAERTARLLNQAARYLRSRAEYRGARVLLERALRIDEAAYGPDHPTVARDVNNLGRVLQDLGDLEGARAHFERALRIDEAAYGPDHPEVAIDVNNLGSVLQHLGDLDGARAHFERALKIDEAAYGPDHPEVATDVNNLGTVLHHLGDLKGAQAHFERGLRIDEAAYGPDHPRVAIRVNNLGRVLKDLGDLKGARAHFERALRIDEAAYGPDHPRVAICVNNLGLVLRGLGDLEGARAQIERALRIDEAAYGPGHPTVAIRVNNLGLVLKDLGDLEGARAQLERALKILRARLGDNHPKTLEAQRNLASLDG
ncbi:MAG: tetratricopeptide repeat protein [Acetobacteraceae bacterium]|nr:tetratricopeptide repeat protein [Acetobacteraceae bacterium]